MQRPLYLPSSLCLKISQLILDVSLGRLESLTRRWSANLHFVHALLRLSDAPELFCLGAPQPDVCPPVGSVPAALAVLVAQDDTLALTEARPVETLLVDDR